MAFQLEVIRFRDLLTVTSAPGFAPGVEVPTLEITGEDLSSAETIFINETRVPEFIIVNKHKIFAQLPEGTKRISTIEVLSSGFTRTVDASKISFEVGNKTRKVDGILKLVQLFTKWILQSPGSDIFNPARGGGLQQIVGSVTTTRDMKPVLASLTRSVNSTVSQIRAAQMGVPTLPLIQSVGGADAVSALVL